MKIKEYLKRNRLIGDGAFGTYFSELTGRVSTSSEHANITNPHLVKEVHEKYIKAGAGLIRTNTFSANSLTLNVDRETQRQIITEGYRLAKEAAEESGKTVFVAGDIGPISENLNLDSNLILEEYKFICDTFLECGADILLFETFSNLKYIKPLAEYVCNKKDVFIMTQFVVNRYGYTKLGLSASRLIEKIKKIPEISSVGFNCGIGAGHMYGVLKKLDLRIDKYISVMPNSGYPELLQDRTVYLDNSKYFAKKMSDISQLGIDIIGGCCGTNPSYIEHTVALVDTVKSIYKNIGKVYEKPLVNTEDMPNTFVEKLKSGKKVIAVELDPPYDAKFDRIMEGANILKANAIDMLTFADSPMGRARVDSILTSIKVMQEVEIPVMPHISCRDRNMIAMRAQLLGAYINNIRNLLIVTGDPIASSDRGEVTSVFDFNSIRLMEFLKEMNLEHFTSEPVFYGGSLNQGRANLDGEINRMKKKIDAGASYLLTQPIFSDKDIENIKYIKTKVDTKILCGIMPLVSYRNASFIQNEITGIHVPDYVVNKFATDMSRKEGEAVGVNIAREVMEKLSDIADGYYFMLPFNRVHLFEECLMKEE